MVSKSVSSLKMIFPQINPSCTLYAVLLIREDCAVNARPFSMMKDEGANLPLNSDVDTLGYFVQC